MILAISTLCTFLNQILPLRFKENPGSHLSLSCNSATRYTFTAMQISFKENCDEQQRKRSEN